MSIFLKDGAIVVNDQRIDPMPVAMVRKIPRKHYRRPGYEHGIWLMQR